MVAKLKAKTPAKDSDLRCWLRNGHGGKACLDADRLTGAEDQVAQHHKQVLK